MKTAAQAVAQLCHDQVGDKLRSVTMYDETGLESVFQRSGLREEYTDAQVTALVETARVQNEILHETGVEAAPLGKPFAGVYAFEEAFVLQLPVAPSRGLVVTMDADVGTSLRGFITACRKRMARSEPTVASEFESG
jgi:hypothetical protein